MNKVTNCILLILLGIIVLAILASTLFMIYPIKVVEFQDDVFPVVEDTVQAGDYIHYQIRGIKYMPLPGTISKTLINHQIYSFPSQIGNTNTGLVDVQAIFKIPDNAGEGVYVLRTTYSYKLWFRQFNYVKDTEPFEVIK